MLVLTFLLLVGCAVFACSCDNGMDRSCMVSPMRGGFENVNLPELDIYFCYFLETISLDSVADCFLMSFFLRDLRSCFGLAAALVVRLRTGYLRCRLCDVESSLFNVLDS